MLKTSDIVIDVISFFEKLLKEVKEDTDPS